MEFDESEQPIHTMILQRTLKSGEDEYYCPTCGRKILLQMEPYKKTVLEAGDEYAIHNGNKGGLQIGAPQITQEQEPSSVVEEAHLTQWEAWLDQINFESWWL